MGKTVSYVKHKKHTPLAQTGDGLGAMLSVARDSSLQVWPMALFGPGICG